MCIYIGLTLTFKPGKTTTKLLRSDKKTADYTPQVPVQRIRPGKINHLSNSQTL